MASSDQRSTHLISRLSREEEANIRDVRGLGRHAEQDMGITAEGLVKNALEQEPMTEAPRRNAS